MEVRAGSLCGCPSGRVVIVLDPFALGGKVAVFSPERGRQTLYPNALGDVLVY
jgi:hypothetical protein